MFVEAAQKHGRTLQQGTTAQQYQSVLAIAGRLSINQALCD
jgi:hypothetical protein